MAIADGLLSAALDEYGKDSTKAWSKVGWYWPGTRWNSNPALLPEYEMTLGGAASRVGRRSAGKSARAPEGARRVAAARAIPNPPTPQGSAVSLRWRISHLPALILRSRLGSAERPPDPLVGVHPGGAGGLLDAPLLRRL